MRDLLAVIVAVADELRSCRRCANPSKRFMAGTHLNSTSPGSGYSRTASAPACERLIVGAHLMRDLLAVIDAVADEICACRRCAKPSKRFMAGTHLNSTSPGSGYSRTASAPARERLMVGAHLMRDLLAVIDAVADEIRSYGCCANPSRRFMAERISIATSPGSGYSRTASAPARERLIVGAHLMRDLLAVIVAVADELCACRRCANPSNRFMAERISMATCPGSGYSRRPSAPARERLMVGAHLMRDLLAVIDAVADEIRSYGCCANPSRRFMAERISIAPVPGRVIRGRPPRQHASD